jgi:uncharacterized protein YjbI with pentapeptide repeats
MNGTVVAAIIAACVSGLTLIGTVVTQIIGFRSTRANTERQIKATEKNTADTLAQQRDQLDKTLGEQRTRTLNERFATAAEQLGDDKPAAVRLAGVYAMAGLADDWPKHRQTCVDVLCAYLRMPYEPDPGENADAAERTAYQANREVRHTVIRVITAHLKDGAAVSWQGSDFDFSSAVFDGGSFANAEFSRGRVNFNYTRFSGGKVNFTSTTFSSGTVSFGHANFSSGQVDFRHASFSGGTVDFDGARFSGGRVNFSYASFSGSTVNFSRDFADDAEFSGGEVYFHFAEFSGSKVNFGSAYSDGVKFSGGEVYFNYARFSGGTVDFRGARFSGGKVNFNDPFDWSVPPAFPWTGTPPPGVILPKKEDQS